MKLTKTINDFDDALHYANKLGYAGKGNIISRQSTLCDIADLLLKVSGQTTWHNVKSFNVKHKRNSKYSCFLVENVVTNKIMVAYPYCYPQIVEYIPNNKLCSGWYHPINDPYHRCIVCKKDK